MANNLIDMDNFLSDLSGLIEIPSISSDSLQVGNALHYTLDLAKKMGLKAYPVLNDRVGVVEMGAGNETLGILVHVDVVPPGNLNQWNSEPFKLVIKEGKLYGRGVADDKGPVISILHAMKILNKDPKRLKKKIQLIIGTQEEVEWTDMDDYVKLFSLPDYGFTPDGEFPITNIEKGYVDVVVDFMTTDLCDILELEAGNSTNSIPDLAVAKVKADYEEVMLKSRIQNKAHENITVIKEDDCVKITIQTLSAHSSKPQKGINAIWVMAKFLRTLNLRMGDYKSILDFIINESVDDYYGKALGLVNDETTYEGQSIDRTVVSPTLITNTKSICQINFNIRQTMGITKNIVESAFANKSAQYGFQFKIENYLDFLFVDRNKPFLKIMSEVYEEKTGQPNEFILAHGTSYAKAMKNFVSWGPYFPWQIDSCHEVNENFELEALLKATEIYYCAMERIATSDKPLK